LEVTLSITIYLVGDVGYDPTTMTRKRKIEKIYGKKEE
jgi:hypothetical protein